MNLVKLLRKHITSLFQFFKYFGQSFKDNEKSAYIRRSGFSKYNGVQPLLGGLKFVVRYNNNCKDYFHHYLHIFFALKNVKILT